jgi:hypothetical protein
MATTRDSGAKGTIPDGLRQCETAWDVGIRATVAKNSKTLSDVFIARENGVRREMDSVIPHPPAVMESRFEDQTEGQGARDASPVKPTSSNLVDGGLPTRSTPMHLQSGFEFDPTTNPEDESLGASRSAQPLASKLPKVSRKTLEHGDPSGLEERDVYSFPVSPSISVHDESRNPNPYIEEPTFLDESSISSSPSPEVFSRDTIDSMAYFPTHGLPVTPPPGTCGEAFLPVPLLNFHPIGDTTEGRHEPPSFASAECSSAGAKELTYRTKLEPCAQFVSLRDELPFKLLSCIERASLKAAKYDDLLDLLKRLSQKPTTMWQDSHEDYLQLEHIALDAWTYMMYMFSNFRRDTGFYGDRDEWTTYAATLEMSRRLTATLRFAEMRCYLAKLKRKCKELTASQMGKMIAPSLWKMAGKPDYLPLEDLADYLCAFCSELFVWFE